MIVKGGAGGRMIKLNPAQVLADFKTNKVQQWGVLRGLYTSDAEAEEVLNDFFDPLQADPANHFIGTVRENASAMVLKQIERVNAKRAFKHDYAFDQIQVQILSQESAFPRGIIWSRVGQVCDIKTQLMKLAIKVAVRSEQKLEPANWQVGFVQTIMRLERRIVISNGNAKAVFKTWLPHACKDGPKDYAEIWYDPGAVAALQPKKFQIIEVSMMDQPGIVWNQKLSETIDSVDGGEVFRTWLVMQRTDKSKVRFLRMWEWHVDYTIAPSNVHRFGITFDGIQPNADGRDAVLAGPTGKNLFESEMRQERSNAVSFEEMRQMAVQNRIHRPFRS
jgi:hypothetical protein